MWLFSPFEFGLFDFPIFRKVSGVLINPSPQWFRMGDGSRLVYTKDVFVLLHGEQSSPGRTWLEVRGSASSDSFLQSAPRRVCPGHGGNVSYLFNGQKPLCWEINFYKSMCWQMQYKLLLSAEISASWVALPKAFSWREKTGQGCVWDLRGLSQSLAFLLAPLSSIWEMQV